jgi:hypothetical protein
VLSYRCSAANLSRAKFSASNRAAQQSTMQIGDSVMGKGNNSQKNDKKNKKPKKNAKKPQVKATGKN